MRGKELRLQQQYFFVACSLQDMLRIHRTCTRSRSTSFHEKFAIQLNDTHPAIAVAELMRLLVDEHGLDWDDGLGHHRATFGYTNHTLLPEALESWPVAMFGALLPRHLEIIYEINRRFLDEVRATLPRRRRPRSRRMSLIDEERRHAACAWRTSPTVGSHAVNGVAALHSELLKRPVFCGTSTSSSRSKFSNKTNGVTPRRCPGAGQPAARGTDHRTIGDGWLDATSTSLRGLEPLADDAAFRRAAGARSSAPTRSGSPQ